MLKVLSPKKDEGRHVERCNFCALPCKMLRALENRSRMLPEILGSIMWSLSFSIAELCLLLIDSREIQNTSSE
jgi:hypothetical protein